MYSHIQTNPQGAFLRFITAGENIEWDANNYCTAFALEKDGKASQFNIHPFYTYAKPAHDTITQEVHEIGPIPVDGLWTQQWEVVPRFTEYTDAADVVHTVAEQEAAALAAVEKAKVPVVVDMAQARLALLGAGRLAAADAAIAGMTGIEGEAARIEWEFRSVVRRDSPLALGTAAALGLTDAQLDQLFITASGL